MLAGRALNGNYYSVEMDLARTKQVLDVFSHNKIHCALIQLLKETQHKSKLLLNTPLAVGRQSQQLKGPESFLPDLFPGPVVGRGSSLPQSLLKTQIPPGELWQVT